MTRLSTEVELAFPKIPPLTFRGLDVALEGAEQGDKVHLVEPWVRQPGHSYFAYVPWDGTVRVCCRNHTVDIVEGPVGTFGIEVSQ